MSGDDTREGRFDHLLSAPVRERITEAGYGSWRSIDAPDAVSLSFGFPYPESLPTADLLEATESLFEAEPERALQYGGGDAATELEGVVRKRAAGRGIDTRAEQVVLTNGATHAIDLVSQAFLEPGAEVIVEAPTFMGALTVFRNYGVELTGVGMTGTGLDVDALAERLRARRSAGRSGPTLVYTIPTFQNPTGTTLPVSDRRRLLELAEEHDFMLLEDDAYGELRYDGEAVPPLAALDDTGRVLHVGTFSKTIAPGVRTGWLIAHEEVAEAIDGLAAGGTNVFTRGLLGKYCENGRLETNLERFRAAYTRRRDRMLTSLEEHMPPGTGWTDPDGGFFVWVTLPEGLDADAMLPAAADEGVTYLPGGLFYPGQTGNDRLRLSFSYADPEAIERGIRALGRTLRTASVDAG